MFRDIFTNRPFIDALTIFIFCVGGSLLYRQHVDRQGAEDAAETEARVEQWNERQKQQSPAEAPVSDTSQGGDFHADGTLHGASQKREGQETLPIESTSALIPSVPPEAAVSEEKPDEAPYHPHDDLSPEEHQRVHERLRAELRPYQAQLDDLIRRYEENLADLQAGRITSEESREFLDKAGEELASIKANIKRLHGE